MAGMEEDLEHCPLDGDEDDDQWSRPVDELHFILDPTHQETRHKETRHKAELQQHSGSAASSQNHPRTIIHIDVDCFYAQVEMIHNPALRDVPLGIQQKYLVVTCNYVARARGVTKLMGVSEAKKHCPELVLVSGEDLTRYREMSYKISEFLMKYTPCIERLGFDENFLDATEIVDQRIRGGTAKTDAIGHVYYPQDCGDQSTSASDSQGGVAATVVDPCPCGCHHRLAVGSQVAADVRRALRVELGITCSAGVAHNKLLSKLAGSRHKPDQQTTVHPRHALALVTRLHSARHIPGIGWATSKRLKAVGVETVEDLQRVPPCQLQEEFGVAMATILGKLALGVDDSPVVTFSRPQTLSVEDSFRCCSSEQDAASRVARLIASLLPRVQEDGRTPRTLRLTVRKANKENRYLHRESRQCNLPSAVAAKITAGQLDVAEKHLVCMAMTLFHKVVDVGRPFHLTLINVAVARLEETASNSITAFLTSQSWAPRSRGHHAAPDEGSLCATPKPPCREAMKSAGDETVADTTETTSCKPKNVADTIEITSYLQNVADTFEITSNLQNVPDTIEITSNPKNVADTIETTPNPKRRLTGDLTSFFLKRQKISDAADDPIEPHVRSARKCDCSTSTQTSELSHNRRNVVLPAGVDPDVFEQLPAEIQREILQTAAPQTLPCRRPTSGSSTPQQNSSDSKQLAVPSTSDFIHRHTPPNSRPQQQRTDGSCLVQVKKDIFSPTKHKIEKPTSVHSVRGQDELLRPKTDDDQTHLADLAAQDEEYVEQKDCTKETDTEFSSSKTGCLPQQSSDDCKMSPPDLETFDTKFQNTPQQSSDDCEMSPPDLETFDTKFQNTPQQSSDDCKMSPPDLETVDTKFQNTPQKSSDDCKMSPPDLETFDTKFQNTPQKPTHSEASDASKSRDSNSPQICLAPKSSLIHSMHNPKMAVPKGVAPDVFCALPPEIRREVAAEMALQKYNVVPSSGNAHNKSQTKSPAKPANSILNYLKRR